MEISQVVSLDKFVYLKFVTIVKKILFWFHMQCKNGFLLKEIKFSGHFPCGF